MGGFILRRVLYMIPTVFLVSIVTFIIIQLPPGDYLDSLAAEMGEAGVDNTAVVEQLRAQYGLGQPMYLQYWKWMTGILLEGDFGISFEKNLPVTDVVQVVVQAETGAGDQATRQYDSPPSRPLDRSGNEISWQVCRRRC